MNGVRVQTHEDNRSSTMNLRFYDFKSLSEEIEKLPPLHRIAFAASCCERLLPNYNAFWREEQWGNPSILRTSLDEIWEILQGKPVDVNTIERLKKESYADDVVPHSDDFSGYVGEAQEAASAIYYTLNACQDSTSEMVVKVSKCIAFTLEFFKDWDETLENQELLEAIARHPFAIREMAKQNQDLQKLREADTLDPELLEWLRTSSCNNGKSLINLS